MELAWAGWQRGTAGGRGVRVGRKEVWQASKPAPRSSSTHRLSVEGLFRLGMLVAALPSLGSAVAAATAPPISFHQERWNFL